MKKNTTRIAAIFLVLLMIAALTGCTNTGFEGKYLLKHVEAGGITVSGSDLTSQMFYPGQDYIEFKTTGIVKSYLGGTEGQGTYTIDGDTITIKSGEDTLTATLDGDILRLEMKNDQIFVFEKAAE